MMTSNSSRFTRADWNRLPEGFPAELIRGELIKEPSPLFGHQAIALKIGVLLLDLLPEDRVGIAPCDVVIDDETVLQPDVLVTARPIAPEERNVGIPLLALEVLSPSTSRRDREVKRRIYLGAGVAEVWIVDPYKRTIEIHTRDGLRRHAGAEVARSAVVEGFTLVADQLFRRSPR